MENELKDKGDDKELDIEFFRNLDDNTEDSNPPKKEYPKRKPPKLPTKDFSKIIPKLKNSLDMDQRFEGSMILAALGDAIGYYNGKFEFENDGRNILKQVKEMGGLKNIDLKGWLVSDDTVMNLATGRGINVEKKLNGVMKSIAREYVFCWDDMNGRAPGGTCGMGVMLLSRKKWNSLPYNKSGGGCGASMRASCIGLRYAGLHNRDMLISVGIESGRLTHNHPTGFIGSLCAASFTAFAIENIPPINWGFIFLNEIIPKALKYCKDSKRDYEKIESDIDYFIGHMEHFLNVREINCEDPKSVKIPKVLLENVKKREEFWDFYSYRGWPGASGDDSCIIAYDALLMSKGNYEKAVCYSCWHGGDSDSTGTLTMAWHGAMYGLNGVYMLNIKNLEKKKEIVKLSKSLCNLYEKSCKKKGKDKK